MSKEIKEEKSKAGVIVAVIAIVVVAGGIMLLKSNADTTIQKTETAAAIKAENKEEKTIARIDLTTKLVNADKPQFEIYIDGSEIPEKQADWMPEFGSQGYVVERNNNKKDINIKAINDAVISVKLKGLRQEKAGTFVEHWVKYTSVSVNGEEILPEPVSVWYNKPFTYTINAKAGEEYKIHVEWTKADYVPEE